MDLDIVREQLLAEKAGLEREVDEFQTDLEDTLDRSAGESLSDQHMAEMASVTLDREMDIALEDGVRSALAKVERALTKLELGTYGVCDNCGRPIDADRLKAVPHAAFCMDCQRRMERGI